MRMRGWLGSMAATLACGCGQGSVEVAMHLPQDQLLRPAGMTSVGLIAEYDDGTSTKTVTSIDGDQFGLGDLEIGARATLAVELRDAGNRVVGYGRSQAPITPSDDSEDVVDVQVRRPLLYVSGGDQIAVYDPSRELTDEHFQQQLGDAGATAVTVTSDGETVLVARGNTIQGFATATHQPTGLALQASGTVRQLVAVPGNHRAVALSDGAVALIDLDAGTLTNVTVANVRKLAVAGSGDDVAIYGLLAPVAINGPGTGCTGSSTVVKLDDAGGTTEILSRPIAAIAGGPDGTSVFAVDPCNGKLVRGEPGGTSTDLATVRHASAVAIGGDRVFALGAQPQSTSGGDTVSARLELTSARLDGSDPKVVPLPALREIVSSLDDPDHELSNVIQADEVTARDLVVLPGGESIAVLSHAWHDVGELTDAFGVIIPEMHVEVDEMVVTNSTNGAITQRVRTQCALELVDDEDAEFPDWKCAARPPEESPIGEEYTPTGIAGIFGGF